MKHKHDSVLTIWCPKCGSRAEKEARWAAFNRYLRGEKAKPPVYRNAAGSLWVDSTVTVTNAPERHQHNNFRCPPHVSGCECEDKPTMACNPYWEADFCPDDIEEIDVHAQHGCDGNCEPKD